MHRTAAIAGLILTLTPGAGHAGEARMAPWLGTWETGFDQTITIASPGEGLISVSGEAYWGMDDPERVANGGVHIGEFATTFPASWISKKDRLSFAVGDEGAVSAAAADVYDCTVWLRLRDGLLEAEDNTMCGGVNVTFSGVYRKVR